MRNYNVESADKVEARYGYRFDYNVMHPFMLRSFIPFFNLKGNILELGCFKGDFTERLTNLFDDISCVEASSEACKMVTQRFNNKIKLYQSLFEDVSLDRQFDNILLMHVLEHIDDPVRILRRINEEWLTDTGKLFLVCPNANAASRQIAVKMGLISHNSAVTKSEKEHGHLITYSIDTLERDVKASGLEIVHKSGIFFKALANFQWDRLLDTNIISQAYLDGCYELGQQYPDLCSSIYFVCQKGKTISK